MPEVGARLRQAREERGLSLQEVERATRIRRALLQALEEDRRGDLPEVYWRGLLRNYAKFLGLDPEPLLKEWAPPSTEEPVHIPYVLDEPLRSARRPFIRGILLLLLVAALAVAAVWYFYGFDFSLERLALPRFWLTGATPTATPPSGEPSPTATLGEVLPPVRVSPTPAAPSPTPTATLTPTPLRPTPTATPRPTLTPTPAAGVYVEAIAQADTYLEVTADGERVWVGILRAGERDAWQANEVLALRVGNAGGLRLLVNGVDVGPLGESGQVIDVEYRAGQQP